MYKPTAKKNDKHKNETVPTIFLNNVQLDLDLEKDKPPLLPAFLISKKKLNGKRNNKNKGKTKKVGKQKDVEKEKVETDLAEFYKAKNAVFSAADKFQLVVEAPAKKKRAALRPVNMNSQKPNEVLVLDVSIDTITITKTKNTELSPKNEDDDILPNIESFFEAELLQLPSSNLELKENVIPNELKKSVDINASFRDAESKSISLQVPLDMSTPSKHFPEHDNNNLSLQTPLDIATMTPPSSLKRSPTKETPQFKTPLFASCYPMRSPLSLLSTTKSTPNDSLTINQSEISRFLDNSMYMNTLLSARKRKLQVSEQRTPKMSRTDLGSKLQTPNGYQPPLSLEELSALNLDLNLSGADDPQPTNNQPNYPPEMLKEYQKYVQLEKASGSTSTSIWNVDQFYQYVWAFSGL